MPEAVITLSDGRRAKLTGPTREAILQQANQLTAQSAAHPEDRQAEELLSRIETRWQEDEMPYVFAPGEQELLNRYRERNPEPRRPTRPYEAKLPFLPGHVSLPGPLARAARAMAGDPETQDTLTTAAMATMGSAAAGPVMTGHAAKQLVAPYVSRLPLLARGPAGLLGETAVRFGPATGGAGAGGAVAGGILEADNPDSTPASIAEAASRSGREMMAAELLGLGIGAGAAGLWAPLSTSLGSSLRPVMEPLKRAREGVSSFFRSAPSETRALARELSERFPDEAAAASAATDRLMDLVSTTTRVSDGERVLRTQKLREVWEALPAEVREGIGGFEKFGQGIRQVGKVANSTVGREALETMAVPLATALFGPGTAGLLWGIRQVVAPGPLARWFQRSELPNPIIQAIGGQATRGTARAGLLSDEE